MAVIPQSHTIPGAMQLIRVATAPTAALTGYPRGATAVNTASGIQYINTGTETVPVWVVVGTQVTPV